MALTVSLSRKLRCRRAVLDGSINCVETALTVILEALVRRATQQSSKGISRSARHGPGLPLAQCVCSCQNYVGSFDRSCYSRHHVP